MSRFYRANCFVYERLLSLQRDELIASYGDEMRFVFREKLRDALDESNAAVLRLWSEVVFETITLSADRILARAQIVIAAAGVASVLAVGSALGFCTLRDTPVVHACALQQRDSQATDESKTDGAVFTLQNGHHMFLECSGSKTATPTVILATGRGLGTAEAWARVQKKVESSIRVCSYDAMGAGQSDHVEGNPQTRPIDQVVEDMHGLFQAAALREPYVLVGASDGGLLVRRYQQAYASEIAGMVLVDSSHEEMEWRDAAISAQFDAKWNDAATLRNNGFLADQQKLNWHADIPLVVLERSQKAPADAFPGLTQRQVDGINALCMSTRSTLRDDRSLDS